MFNWCKWRLTLGMLWLKAKNSINKQHFCSSIDKERKHLGFKSLSLHAQATCVSNTTLREAPLWAGLRWALQLKMANHYLTLIRHLNTTFISLYLTLEASKKLTVGCCLLSINQGYRAQKIHCYCTAIMHVWIHFLNQTNAFIVKLNTINSNNPSCYAAECYLLDPGAS